MRMIGFSTGALALGNFSRALDMLAGTSAAAVELSALRLSELEPVVSALPNLSLGQFRHVSFHAPSQFGADDEAFVVGQLRQVVRAGIPVVVHPDVIRDDRPWREWGPDLILENMDRRKPIGQTADHMASLFARFPDASLCLDLGHARQLDSTMAEAYHILDRFGSRLRQVHLSEVDMDSRHCQLSLIAAYSFIRITPLIPAHVPVILETPVSDEAEMAAELRNALYCFPERFRCLTDLSALPSVVTTAGAVASEMRPL